MQPPTLLPARALSVPVTPDAEEARRAAEEELSKPAYRERRSLWEALWDWLASHLDPGAVLPGLPAWAGWVIVLSVLAALVAVMVLMLGRLRMVRRARSLGAGLFDSDHRDARTLVQAADSAAAEGLWATAVIERFRAIIRSLDERGLVEDYPGMTAQEAAARAGSALGHEVLEAAAELQLQVGFLGAGGGGSLRRDRPGRGRLEGGVGVESQHCAQMPDSGASGGQGQVLGR